MKLHFVLHVNWLYYFLLLRVFDAIVYKLVLVRFLFRFFFIIEKSVCCCCCRFFAFEQLEKVTDFTIQMFAVLFTFHGISQQLSIGFPSFRFYLISTINQQTKQQQKFMDKIICRKKKIARTASDKNVCLCCCCCCFVCVFGWFLYDFLAACKILLLAIFSLLALFRSEMWLSRRKIRKFCFQECFFLSLHTEWISMFAFCCCSHTICSFFYSSFFHLIISSLSCVMCGVCVSVFVCV